MVVVVEVGFWCLLFLEEAAQSGKKLKAAKTVKETESTDLSQCISTLSIPARHWSPRIPSNGLDGRKVAEKVLR